jgi:hypothetical protein
VKLPKNLGKILLAIWLIIYGAVALFELSFKGLPLLMAVLAIAAGVFLLLDRS